MTGDERFDGDGGRPRGRGNGHARTLTPADRRELYRRTPRIVTREVTLSCPLECVHRRAEARFARPARPEPGLAGGRDSGPDGFEPPGV